MKGIGQMIRNMEMVKKFLEMVELFMKEFGKKGQYGRKLMEKNRNRVEEITRRKEPKIQEGKNMFYEFKR